MAAFKKVIKVHVWPVLKTIGKWLLATLLSKEVFAASIAAVIAALVLIKGYTQTANDQRNLQLNQNTATAYSNFLNQIELTLPTPAEEAIESTSTYNDRIRKLNAALAVLETTASNCVIQNIHHEVFNDGALTFIGTPQISMMQLILHNDLYGQECTSTEVTSSSFVYFYFQPRPPHQ